MLKQMDENSSSVSSNLGMTWLPLRRIIPISFEVSSFNAIFSQVNLFKVGSCITYGTESLLE